MGFRLPLHNPLDARISHWGRPFPTFVAGTTHLKLQESNAVGLRQDPSQNPRWLKIGNAHPWRKTAKDGPRTARRRERYAGGPHVELKSKSQKQIPWVPASRDFREVG